MASLLPCTSCGRHVRIRDAACPFCSAVQPSDRAAPVLTRARAKRAVAFVAASMAVAACGSNTGSPSTPGGTSSAASSAAPTATPATDPLPDAPQVRYGLPPFLAADDIV
ncbi:MAG: hypothetical protein U0414_35510 [Polyangiaceae bacterium]